MSHPFPCAFIIQTPTKKANLTFLKNFHFYHNNFCVYIYLCLMMRESEVGRKIYLIKNLISASLNDKINLTFILRHFSFMRGWLWWVVVDRQNHKSQNLSLNVYNIRPQNAFACGYLEQQVTFRFWVFHLTSAVDVC